MSSCEMSMTGLLERVPTCMSRSRTGFFASLSLSLSLSLRMITNEQRERVGQCNRNKFDKLMPPKFQGTTIVAINAQSI